MGDTFQTIADPDASARDAARLAGRVVEWLVAEGIVLADAEPGWALGEHPAHPPGPHWHKAVADARWGSPEGVAVHTGRRVCFTLRDPGPDEVTCPRCGQRATVEGDLEHRFRTACDAWYGTGRADVDCPACAVPVPLPAWAWTDDAFAFAHLGFEFWNWPALSEEFRARTAGFLDGHRTAFLMGKI
ncbi:hypothetical protein KEF29_30465 [Streptomyces tuirus]|uniref:Uncharacterized protein n=1 Tax=Streptomyces tuirus TaxID=68278 RepID=A0A941J4E2_9ACTN|nr:hypothetical protein [Streptomyces tuirus]